MDTRLPVPIECHKRKIALSRKSLRSRTRIAANRDVAIKHQFIHITISVQYCDFYIFTVFKWAISSTHYTRFHNNLPQACRTKKNKRCHRFYAFWQHNFLQMTALTKCAACDIRNAGWYNKLCFLFSTRITKQTCLFFII